jgi:tetratricopeptide (TPR) repeat protein
MKTSATRKMFFAVMLISTCRAAQPGGYLSQGNDYYREGDYDKAVASYRNAIDNSENPALSWFNLGNAYYQGGTFRNAVSCYETAVMHAPDFARGWINLGVLYYELQDFGACIAALEKALTLNSEDAMVYSVLASAHKDLEQYGSAAIYLEKVLEIDSTLSDAILMLYEIARLTGDRKEAQAWLSKYPEKGGRFYDVQILSGDLLLEKGDTAAALAVFRTCTRFAPERTRGWISLVNLLHRLDADYTALEEARMALESTPPAVGLALLAGRIAFDGGYYDKAEFFFTTAYRGGHPDGVVGLGNLTAIYNRFGDNAGITRIKAVLDDDYEK